MDKLEAGRTECPYCRAKGPASYGGTRAGYIQYRCNCCGKTWELPAPLKEGQSRGPFQVPRYAAGIAPPWDLQLKLHGFVVGAPETSEDAQTSLRDLEQKIRAFEVRFPRAELETGVGASGREWGRLHTRHQNLVSYMVHRGWLKKVKGDDNANAESRTDELQHFTEVVVRLHELKRLHPLWAHEGAAGLEFDYLGEIRELTAELNVAIECLEQFGIGPQDSKKLAAQICENWDTSRNLELRSLAGTSSPSVPAEPSEPQQRLRAASSGERPKGNRRRKKKELTAREKNVLAILTEDVQRKRRGFVYCHALELKKIPPPPEWTTRGCPTTYPEAYKLKAWRHRIQDEKYRLSQFLPQKRTRRSSPTS